MKRDIFLSMRGNEIKLPSLRDRSKTPFSLGEREVKPPFPPLQRGVQTFSPLSQRGVQTFSPLSQRGAGGFLTSNLPPFSKGGRGVFGCMQYTPAKILTKEN